jgi:alpha-glucosidase (family GH31 glycosyl hydrolase)
MAMRIKTTSRSHVSRARIAWSALSCAFRNPLLLAVGAVALLTLPATGDAAAASSAVSWKASTKPFRLAFRVGSTTRVGGGRFVYRLADGSLHELGAVLNVGRHGTRTLYRVATDEPGRTAFVGVTPTKTGVSVSFSLKPATNVAETTAAFAGRHGEHFLGGGERDQALDLAGQSLPVKASSACVTPMPAPFYVSSRGYGVAMRTSAVASMSFPGANLSDMCWGEGAPCKLTPRLADSQVCVKAARFGYDLLVGTPEQIVADYVRSVGTTEIPPPSTLELMKWRDSIPGPAPLFDDVDRLHALGIPIGWEMLDNPWESGGCLGTLTFDSAFGDPRTLVGAIHARGVKLMLWISPLVRLDCPTLPQYGAGALVGSDGPSAAIDLTSQPAAKAFEQSLRGLVSLGVDGFKADRGNEADLEGLQLAGGKGVVLHNAYPLLYARAVAAAVEAAGKQSSFVSIFHAASPGSAALVAGFWGGDQPGSFRGIREAIHAALSAGIVGDSVWGSDIGGYLPTDSAETFVRWAQLSAVTPIFEVGGQGQNGTFWDYGPQTVDLFRSAAILHYELFPYLYSLIRSAHVTGTPVLRPPALEYPSEAAFWKDDYELLVGPDLLAAPVVQPAPTPVAVDLPPGTWVDLASGAHLHGPSSSSKVSPLSELPLYLRSGAVIPFAARTPAIWSQPWPVDALQLAGRGGWLYAPAPGVAEASTPEFGSFHATVRGTTAVITLRGAPRETQVLLVGQGGLRVVRIDGETVAASPSDAALQQQSVGWEPTQTPFRGVVLKLAPTAGATTVTLTLP